MRPDFNYLKDIFLTQQSWTRALDNKFSLQKAQKNYYKALTTSQLLINIFTLGSKGLLSKKNIISKADGESGERIKKNGFAGVRAMMISGTWDLTLMACRPLHKSQD